MNPVLTDETIKEAIRAFSKKAENLDNLSFKKQLQQFILFLNRVYQEMQSKTIDLDGQKQCATMKRVDIDENEGIEKANKDADYHCNRILQVGENIIRQSDQHNESNSSIEKPDANSYSNIIEAGVRLNDMSVEDEILTMNVTFKQHV